MNTTSIPWFLSQPTGWPDAAKTVPNNNSILINILFSSTVTELCIFASILLGLFYTIHSQPRVKAPYVGYRSWLEPTFLLRVRGLTSCKSIVAAGYQKYKNSVFYIRRVDGDTLILSNKYLEELRLLPNTILSNAVAQFQNLSGHYTHMHVILHSDLHARALMRDLTPNVAFYTTRSKAEFDHAFYQLLPRKTEWTDVDIQAVTRDFVARMTTAVFLGAETARNKDWLKLSIQYPMDIFSIAFLLRMVPAWAHPVVARLLPWGYRVKSHRSKARVMIQSLMEKRQKDLQAGSEVEHTILGWMTDNAKNNEADYVEMTSRQLVLTLGSIHTTALALSHALYDLCAHPEYVEPLREEIERVSKQYTGNDFVKYGLQRLEKLDSFLVESQRFHPPVLTSPQRVALKPITLHDGTQIPKGTSIAFPSAAIQMDSSVIPDPERFNGFRSYEKRQIPGQEHHHLWVQTDKQHLVFGHGKQACPGRHFAASEIKVVLARILTEFDMKNPQGEVRPKTYYLDEYIFPDPNATLLFRHRGESFLRGGAGGEL